MKLDIKFVCETCWLRNNDRQKYGKFQEHEWEDLNSAVDHIKNNPDHVVTAETEITL